MIRADRAWALAVCAVCDPVMERADVGFVREPLREGPATALLWEADPLRFVERYPDSPVVASYGNQWPPPCLDFWVYVDAATAEARFSVEGVERALPVVALTGDGAADGRAIATVLATVLEGP